MLSIHKLVNFFVLQGEIIKSSPDNGFIMNEGNLIIQSVKRGSTGPMKNQDKRSVSFFLLQVSTLATLQTLKVLETAMWFHWLFNVRFKSFCVSFTEYFSSQDAPVCLSQGQAVGVAKGEESRVVCQVDSNPAPTNFK